MHIYTPYTTREDPVVVRRRYIHSVNVHQYRSLEIIEISYVSVIRLRRVNVFFSYVGCAVLPAQHVCKGKHFPRDTQINYVLPHTAGLCSPQKYCFYAVYATNIVHKVYKSTAQKVILSTSFLRLFYVIGIMEYSGV